jgi:DNA polymerase (family 10)
MSNKELIHILNELSGLLLLKGENEFKARAYSNAADIIITNKLDIIQIAKDGELSTIKGFGDALQSKISDYVSNGKMAYYENLKAEIPEGLIDISKISGLGPKKARSLFYDSNIISISELMEICENGKLADIKGFGEKSAKAILEGIYRIKNAKGKFLQHIAYTDAEDFLKFIKPLECIEKAAVSGELIRWQEEITYILVVLTIKKNESISELLDFLKLKYEIEQTVDYIEFINENGLKFKILVCESQDFTWLNHKHSCNLEYFNAFTEFASYQGFEIKNEGIFKNSVKIISDTEEKLYNNLSLQFVPVEIREEPQSLQFANTGQIPELIQACDMKGMFHCHSTWSDGKHSLRDMALATKELGFSYFAICDHSRSAFYANGLSIDRVLQQHEEINKLNQENLGIKILKGIESDILPDGSLDYPDDILAKFDIIVASVHNGFKMSKLEMTDRIIKAVSNPFTTILGHPTGRLILSRPGYELEIEAVIDTAKTFNKVIEINASPRRLDLNWKSAQLAKMKGVKLAINPDAHNTENLKQYVFGINQARKAWLTKNDVINTLSLFEFEKQIINKFK